VAANVSEALEMGASVVCEAFDVRQIQKDCWLNSSGLASRDIGQLVRISKHAAKSRSNSPQYLVKQQF
jgi:hypothetical protein